MVAHVATLPELADHADRLFEAFLSDFSLGPSLANDVFVEVFTGPDAQKEAAWHQRRGRGRGLDDDRGMDPHRRARDGRAQRHPIYHLGNCAEHAPDEGTLTLPVSPGMVVVRDQRELETALPGFASQSNEIGRRLFLARQFVAEGDRLPRLLSGVLRCHRALLGA